MPSTQALLVPIGGAVLVLLLVFQLLMGLRVIKFKGPLHAKVHKWTGFALIAVAIGHGLFATHTFFSWPF
jgi:hypothetical protein